MVELNMIYALETGAWVGIAIACLVAGLLIGFFVTRYIFKKQLRDNPPINEKMIRVMFAQMGRKPSEKQIREIMNSMRNSQ